MSVQRGSFLVSEFDQAKACAMLLRALRRVLSPAAQTTELRDYFIRAVKCCTSTHSAEDGFSDLSMGDLEQIALLFMHFDADSDGLLSLTEFTALLQLASARSGLVIHEKHNAEKAFRDADLDQNDVVDLNEMILFCRNAMAA